MNIDELLEQHKSDNIDELRANVMAGKVDSLEPADTQELPTSYRELENELIEGMAFADELNAKIDAMKKKLLEAMEANGVKQWKSDRMTISYIEPSFRSTFDSKKLKAENPALYEHYTKQSETKSSIRITIKKTA